MQLPEVSVNTYKMHTAPHGEVGDYEHVVSVLLPWRRYLRDAYPLPCDGSPSRIEIGEESRHGTELSVIRPSADAVPSGDELGEMCGELAEAWVFLTLEMSTSVDPRGDISP